MGWRAQYEVLLRRYGLEEEDEGQAGSVAEWKRRVRKLNGSEWKEEVEAMSSERYFWCGEVCCIIDNRVLCTLLSMVASWEGNEAIRLRFQQHCTLNCYHRLCRVIHRGSEGIACKHQ